MYKLILVFLLASAPAFAQDFMWKDTTGNLVPDTPDRKAIDNFGGWLVITSDMDWEEKWNTPPDDIPSFTTVETVKQGDRLSVLIFFSNPGLGLDGETDIRCDLKVLRPDGTTSALDDNATCFEGPIEGPQQSIRLAYPFIGFIGEPTDPTGRWIVRVVLRDNVRHVEVPLEASFELQ